MSDPRMRFRVWVAAQLVDETWVDSSNPDADRLMANVLARHAQIVEAASRTDQLWLVEAYDPEQPGLEAFWRYGTDRDGMIDPREVDP